MTIKGKAYIAGIYEHPTRHAPDKSTAQLHAEVAKGALEDDELTDLGTSPAHAEVLAAARARLEAVLDPVAVDRRARTRQGELLAANGGREAVIARGDLGFSVPPGVSPMFD